METIGAQKFWCQHCSHVKSGIKPNNGIKVDVLFKLKGAGDRDLALGPTHEEVVTPLMGRFIQSYRDLRRPFIKFEQVSQQATPKSGLLRGREFRTWRYVFISYGSTRLGWFLWTCDWKLIKMYRRYNGLGDSTLLTYASGGVFSKYSHEFQTVTPYGEDIVYRVPDTDIAINKGIDEWSWCFGWHYPEL